MPNNRQGCLKIGVLLGSALLFSGCATTFAHRIPPHRAGAGNGDTHTIENVPPVAQKAYQCGPAALESVIRYWGRDINVTSMTETLFKPGSMGVLNFTLSEYARTQGFWTEIHEEENTGNGINELKTWILRKIPPVVMLKTGILWVPTYHFVVLRGHDDTDQIFYANIGEPETYAIPYSELRSRWKASGNWYLIICPPERVDWDLDEIQSQDLAIYSEKSGKADLAEKWYRRVLNKNPANQTARFNLANVYLKQRRFEEAKPLYESLSIERPDWGPAVNNLAWIYLEEGNPKEALSVIETSFKNGAERRFDSLDTLGVAHCRLKEYEQARGYLSEALRGVPAADEKSRELIGRHLSECKQMVLFQKEG